MFKKPFSFEGRIRRTEYGLSYLLFFVYVVIVSAVLGVFSVTDEGSASMLLIFVVIPAYWFLLAQGAKRCHDRGNSGWFQIIPFYGFWMLFADSDNGVNRYGPNPKGIGNTDEIDEIGYYLSK